MPRVLRILNRLNIGGPTFNAVYLSKYLAPEFETLLAAGQIDPSEGSSSFIAEQEGLQPHYIPDMHRELNPLKDTGAYRHIRQLIRDYKPDIVHTHAAKAGAVGRLAAIHEKVPVILHTFHGHVFHSYFNPVKTRIFLSIERYLARHSTRIIAISPVQKYELGTLHRVCDPSKIEVIPLGFDLSKFQDSDGQKRLAFRSKYQLQDDEVAVGIIGRLVPVKNHTLFLESLARVLGSSRQKIRAFIIGDGEERNRIEALAASLGIGFSTETNLSNIQPLCFTSWIRDIDVATAGLDIIALSSLNEGTPVSLIEAQAASRPVVSTRVGGIEDVVIEGQTALLSPSGDAAAFAANLLRLTEDTALRLRMGAGAAAHVLDKYSYSRLVRDMGELYRRLLSQPAQNAR